MGCRTEIVGTVVEKERILAQKVGIQVERVGILVLVGAEVEVIVTAEM